MVRGVRSRFPLLVALVPAAVACFPPSHFADISDTLARRDLHCTRLTVVELEDASWGIRAQGCGQVAYYRCSYGHKSMGRRQCCHRVASEDEATALLAPAVEEGYCEDHYP